jgi:hypothetical protein
LGRRWQKSVDFKKDKMIELIIKQIAKKIPPSSGKNLSGFTVDLDYAFGESKNVFYPYIISTTPNPHQLIVAKAQITNKVKDLQNVFETAEKIWTAVAYRHFEASNYQLYREGAILRFISVISSESLFVSGLIILEGEKYQRLISEVQQKTKKDYSSLPSISIFDV